MLTSSNRFGKSPDQSYNWIKGHMWLKLIYIVMGCAIIRSAGTTRCVNFELHRSQETSLCALVTIEKSRSLISTFGTRTLRYDLTHSTDLPLKT